VKPGRTNEYKELVSEYYDKLAKDPAFDIKLTGSWEVVVGDIDSFCMSPNDMPYLLI
jgi:hypothetical protein